MRFLLHPRLVHCLLPRLPKSPHRLSLRLLHSSTMSSPASFPSPELHIHTRTSLHTKRKPRRDLHFLSIPNPSTSSFPLTINSTSSPIQFHPLSDSVHDDLVHYGIQSTKQIGKSKSDLRRRQIKEETEAWNRTVEEYRELEREMREKNLAPNLPHVKSLFLWWFNPLREAIAREQKLEVLKKKHKPSYSHVFDILPAAKTAIIVMHEMVRLLMLDYEAGCVHLVHAAVQIGKAIEEEVRIHKILEKARIHPQGKKTMVNTEDRLNNDKCVEKEEFDSLIRASQARLGCRLMKLLIEPAYVQPPLTQSADSPPDIRPAFRHKFQAASKSPRQKIVKYIGVIECDPLVLAGLDKSCYLR